jgi:HEAT repeat protein
MLHRPAIALSLCLAQATGWAAQQADGPDAGGARALIARAVESEDAALALASDLAELGPAALPELFAILAERDVDADPDARVELDPLSEQALLEALAALPSASVRAHLAGLDRPALSDGERRAAIQVYGAIGAGEDLRGLVGVAAPLDPRAPIALELRRAFLEACTAVLARDELATRYVRGAFDVAPPSLKAQLIAALRSRRGEPALRVLGTLLGASAEFDLLALSAIGDLARGREHAAALELGSTVLSYLTGPDERLAQAAAEVLAELEDPRAVPDLIALLDAPQANLRASANRALVRTAGRDLSGDQRQWQSWYDAEQAWWRRHEAGILERLRSQHDAEVARALNEVGAHRLFRRELEYSLIEELDGDDPLILAMACVTLGRLGSRAAAPELEALAEHSDPRVVEAARLALRRIAAPPSGPEGG